MENTEYKSMTTRFAQNNVNCMLLGELTTYGWNFKIFDSTLNKHILDNTNLQQLLELILLGKMCKEQLTKAAEEKVEKASVR